MNTQSPGVSKKVLWASYVMSALPVLLFLFGGIMKLVNPPGLAQEFTRLGIPEKLAAGLGILEIAFTIIYAIPRTAVLGAILLTGYLGGAILTHLRVGEPFFMPVIIGIVIWGGIYLRDPRLHELIPFRRMPAHARESEVKSMGEPHCAHMAGHESKDSL